MLVSSQALLSAPVWKHRLFQWKRVSCPWEALIPRSIVLLFFPLSFSPKKYVLLHSPQEERQCYCLLIYWNTPAELLQSREKKMLSYWTYGTLIGAPWTWKKGTTSITLTKKGSKLITALWAKGKLWQCQLPQALSLSLLWALNVQKVTCIHQLIGSSQ